MLGSQAGSSPEMHNVHSLLKCGITLCLMAPVHMQIMVAIAEKQHRPPIPRESDLPGGSFPSLPAYLDLMQACWHAEPQEWPAFESCIITLRGLLEEAMTVK
jgi:hypothetical protein